MRFFTRLNALVVPLLLTGLGVVFLVQPNAQQVSQAEARVLATWPRLSFEGVRDGSYTRDVEMFIADHFPLRDRFVDFTTELRARWGVTTETSFYVSKGKGLGGMEQADDWSRTRAVLVADAAVGEELLEEADAGEEFDAGEEVDDAGVVIEEEPDAGVVEEGESKIQAGVLIHNGRGMMLLSASDENARSFADVVNLYASTFPDVKVYAMVVPSAATFYLPQSQKSRSADEVENLEVVHSHLSASVGWVDVRAALAPHVAEDIYYRTDHHWTGLGAWYGYAAFCGAAGLEPTPKESLTWKARPGRTFGSLHRMTLDRTLREATDVTRYYLPAAEYSAVAYLGERQDSPVRATFIDEHGFGYLTYLGGDNGLMVARTKVKNGKRALLLKNSFGNPLGGLLLAHYETVLVVDYRFVTRSVAALIRANHITDLIIQNATLTLNERYHREQLRKVLLNRNPRPLSLATDGGAR